MTGYDDGTYDTHSDEDYLNDQYGTEPTYEQIIPPQAPAQRQRPVPAPRPARVEHLPVGDVETETTMAGLVKITRSMSLGSRNDQVHMGIELPFPIQPGWRPERIAQAAADTFSVARSVLYEQLGVDFTVDEGGVVREVIRHQFPGTSEERAGAASQRSDQGSGGGSRYTPPREMNRPDHVNRRDWDDLVDNPDDWFDNREDKQSGKYKDTAPDFKHRGSGNQVAIWLRPLRSGGNNRHQAQRSGSYSE
jgi:hypothetical protein